ncbi:MAG: hypothetical protein ACK58L_01955 [Planctomycetota bacterium]
MRINTSSEETLSGRFVGRGSASIDFDNDGDLDLLAVDYEGPFMLLRNETESSNHWLKLNLRGRSPDIFGNCVKVIVTAGHERWVNQMSPSAS